MTKIASRGPALKEKKTVASEDFGLFQVVLVVAHWGEGGGGHQNTDCVVSFSFNIARNGQTS